MLEKFDDYIKENKKIKAYKIWHDTKNFIHKDSTVDKIIWTENIKDAKEVENFTQAVKFFYDELGFNLNSKYDALHLLGHDR